MTDGEYQLLILPGLGNSGAGHWQTLWQERHPRARRVEQEDWDAPSLPAWLDRLQAELERLPAPAVLVAHSLGCLLAAHLARRIRPCSALDGRIAGAFLVAPPDVDSPFHTPSATWGFRPVPIEPLPFPSIVVASRNDPYMPFRRSRFFARAWGADWVDAGLAGHINVASGHGDWPEGERRLNDFIAQAHTAAHLDPIRQMAIPVAIF